MSREHGISGRVLRRSLLSGWAGLSIEVVVGFLLTPFTVQRLGATAYGIWSLLSGLLGYLGLIDLGIRGSVGRYVNHYIAQRDARRLAEVVTTSLAYLTLMSVLMLVITFVAGAHFITLFPKTPPDFRGAIATALPILATGLWLTMASAVFRQLILAQDGFDVHNGIQAVWVLLRAALVVYVLMRGGGIVELAAAVVIVNLVGTAMLGWTALRLNPDLSLSRRYVSLERLREIWRFGLATFLTRTANQLIYQTDSVLVMLFFGPAAVAIYSIAATMLQYGQRLVEQVASTFYPSVTKSGAVRDFEALRHSFYFQARLAFTVATLVYGGFIVFGGAAIDLWVGREYHGAWLILGVLSLAELVSLMTSSGGSALFALNRVRFNLLSAVIEALVNLGLSIAFVLLLGRRLVGVALGTLVAALLMRGIVHPIYTLTALKARVITYYATIGARVALLLGLSLGIFTLLRWGVPPTNWGRLGLVAMLATLVYLPLSIALLFERGTLPALASRLLRRSREGPSAP